MKRMSLLLALTLVLGACATGAKMGAMIASVTEESIISDESVLRHAIEVTDISGGKETNPLWISRVSNENFREALVQSLAAHTMINKDNAARFHLRAELTELQQPIAGFSLTVTVIVRYSLSDIETNYILFDRLIETSYKANFDDAFYATKRLRLANEGAARANIEEFIRQLIADAVTNTAFQIPVASRQSLSIVNSTIAFYVYADARII